MRAERLDELEALPADLDRLHLGWTKGSKTPALLDDLNNVVVVFPPSDKQTAAAVYFGAARPHLLAELLVFARAVSEWREADAAWQTARANPSSTPDLLDRTLHELRAAEARLRGLPDDA